MLVLNWANTTHKHTEMALQGLDLGVGTHLASFELKAGYFKRLFDLLVATITIKV